VRQDKKTSAGIVFCRNCATVIQVPLLSQSWRQSQGETKEKQKKVFFLCQEKEAQPKNALVNPLTKNGNCDF
jgi:hypothetical protein